MAMSREFVLIIGKMLCFADDSDGYSHSLGPTWFMWLLDNYTVTYH